MGAFLEQNVYVVIAVSIITFIGGLTLAYRWLGSGVSEDATRPPRQSWTPINRLPRAGSLQQDK
jgi:hypothetical protein